MSVLEDLLNDINTYPADNITITVVDFDEPGTQLNVGEVASFRVRVTNSGHLDMRNLKLHIEGSAWASVGLSPLPWAFSGSVITGAQDVNAHAIVTYGPFFMRANSATTGNQELFTVHISTYDADLEHILIDHGHHASNPERAYSRTIFPS